MQSSWYSSRLKAVINHVRKYKSLVFISSLDGQKKKLLNERKCPEAVVRKCSVKKLFLNISEHFQEKTCSEVSFYHSYRSQGLSSEFCEIFNDTGKTVFYSVQYKNGWLAASDLFDVFTRLHNQLSSIIHCITRIKSTDVWKMWFIK